MLYKVYGGDRPLMWDKRVLVLPCTALPAAYRWVKGSARDAKRPDMLAGLKPGEKILKVRAFEPGVR